MSFILPIRFSEGWFLYVVGNTVFQCITKPHIVRQKVGVFSYAH